MNWVPANVYLILVHFMKMFFFGKGMTNIAPCKTELELKINTQYSIILFRHRKSIFVHTGLMLMLKPKEKKDVSHKPLSQIGQRKNPFRLGSQVTPKAAQGTSVFDSMQRSSASKTKTPSEPKLKPKPIKLRKPVSVDVVLHEEYRITHVPEFLMPSNCTFILQVNFSIQTGSQSTLTGNKKVSKENVSKEESSLAET